MLAHSTKIYLKPFRSTFLSMYLRELSRILSTKQLIQQAAYKQPIKQPVLSIKQLIKQTLLSIKQLIKQLTKQPLLSTKRPHKQDKHRKVHFYMASAARKFKKKKKN